MGAGILYKVHKPCRYCSEYLGIAISNIYRWWNDKQIIKINGHRTQTHLLKHFKISKMSSGPCISKNALRAKVQVKSKSIKKRSRK